jgi:thiosulfate/3-mercaptopyruvate sulfurtransferase
MITRLHRIALMIAMILIGLTSAVPWARSAEPPQSMTPGAPAVREEMLVTTQWLANHLNGSTVKILHVGKKRASYIAGHIPGSRFLDGSDLATTVAGIPNEIPPLAQLTTLMARLGVENSDRVIVYDEEAGLLAARAYLTLDYLGMGGRTALLDGQFKKWRAEKRELSQAIPSFAPSGFTAHTNPQVIAYFEEVQNLTARKVGLSKAGACLIDARPEKQYTGADAGEGIARPGHIPGAVSVPWTRAIQSEANPVLRPPAELRAELGKAGIQQGAPVIAYCRTGGQASFSYFMLKHLGYDVKMYDGSYYEWTRKPETQVEK